MGSLVSFRGLCLFLVLSVLIGLCDLQPIEDIKDEEQKAASNNVSSHTNLTEHQDVHTGLSIRSYFCWYFVIPPLSWYFHAHSLSLLRDRTYYLQTIANTWFTHTNQSHTMWLSVPYKKCSLFYIFLFQYQARMMQAILQIQFSTIFPTLLPCFEAFTSSVVLDSWLFCILSSGLVVWGGDEEQPEGLVLASTCRSMLVELVAKKWSLSGRELKMMMKTPFSIHLSQHQATQQLKSL